MIYFIYNKAMNITKTHIKEAKVKLKHLAASLGVSPAMVTKMPEVLPDQYQYRLRFGTPEAKAIRRKVLRHIKANT